MMYKHALRHVYIKSDKINRPFESNNGMIEYALEVYLTRNWYSKHANSLPIVNVNEKNYFKIDTSNKPRHFMDIPMDSFISFMMSFVLYYISFYCLLVFHLRIYFEIEIVPGGAVMKKAVVSIVIESFFLKDCNKKCKIFILSCMIECKGMSGCLTECHAPAARRSAPPPSYTAVHQVSKWTVC